MGGGCFFKPFFGTLLFGTLLYGVFFWTRFWGLFILDTFWETICEDKVARWGMGGGSLF